VALHGTGGAVAIFALSLWFWSFPRSHVSMPCIILLPNFTFG
jgi:hypothetical protein